MVGVRRAKMRAGGFEVGRIALGELMDVNGMLAGGQVLYVQLDFYAFGRGGESGGADVVAVGVSDLDGRGFGLAERRRRECGGRGNEDKDSGKLQDFHRVIPFAGNARTGTIMQSSVQLRGSKR